MDEQLLNQVKIQMSNLPEDVRRSVLSVDYQLKLREIVKRQRLLIDQAGSLEIETLLVMIGLEPLSQFVPNLQKNLNLPILRAKELAMDVSENIFKPIRKSLHELKTNQDDGEVVGINKTTKKEVVTAPNPTEIKTKTNEAPNLAIEVATDARYQKDFQVETKQKEPSPTEQKLNQINLTQRVVIQNPTNTKLPPVEKKLPTDGLDPYRELI